jgi:hypothetical protein
MASGRAHTRAPAALNRRLANPFAGDAECMAIATIRSKSDARKVRECRERFLEFFPKGFRDPIYLDTERAYKWEAHRRWTEQLGRNKMMELIDRRAFKEIADSAIRIESRTNLLFSFEKIALRHAVSEASGARVFARALSEWLYGRGRDRERFVDWCRAVASLPHPQSRVFTWPVVTVFGFVARPRVHLILKPTVTRRAAEAYGFPFDYQSRPRVETYESLLGFAARVRHDLRDLKPRDMIDIQSFLWVQGSDEYA